MIQGSHFTKFILIYLAILILAVMPVASQASGPPTDPYLDPKNDLNNPLRYITSNTSTAIAFALVTTVAHVQAFYAFRYGAKWMLAMVIGELIYAIGFGCRFGLHYHPDSKAMYIAEYLLIVLSPCAFIAADYILLGRLARHLSCTKHVLLPAEQLTFTFLSSDVTTFMIQAIGGGMSVSHKIRTQEIGSHIFLAGLALQLTSFTFFSSIYIRFLHRVYTLDHDVWERDKALPWYRDWRTLAAVLVISCTGILIRSCYRVAEFSQGYSGHLATTEAFFYGLDTFPLFVATSIYVVFWPGWFIKDKEEVQLKWACDVYFT